MCLFCQLIFKIKHGLSFLLIYAILIVVESHSVIRKFRSDFLCLFYKQFLDKWFRHILYWLSFLIVCRLKGKIDFHPFVFQEGWIENL